jgi:predicted dehydrogenase
VVGCGRIADSYMQAIAAAPSLRLRAIVEPDAARRAVAAARLGIEAFADTAPLLARRGAGPPCAAALVLTPPDTHEAIATALLQEGMHVLCEKPLAPGLAAAERMVQAAERAGRVLMMGSKFRFTEDMQQARALLDDGAIGDVLLFENVFCSRVDMTRRWNGIRAVAGGGVLIDNGCHSVDIARYLLGPIARVQAQFGKPVQPLEVEDTARLLFESSGGAMGSIDLSWSLHKEVPSYVQLYGSRGTMEIGWRVSRTKLEGQADWTAFGRGYDKVAAFAAQLRNFAGVIAGTEPPVITHEDALASVSVIEEAYRSATEQKWRTVR